MGKTTDRVWASFLKKLRTIVFAGLVVVVPIALTIWILVWLISGIENMIQPLVVRIFGHTYPGVGLGVMIVLILIIGAITTNVLGRRMVKWGESMLGKIPVINRLYVALRDISRSFSDPAANGFLQVVLVDFPYKGMKAIGFVTNIDVDKDGRKVLNVFIPNTPNPTTGFLEIMHEEDVVRTNISVEDALKMVVSGGRMSPKDFSKQITDNNPPTGSSQSPKN